MEEIVVVPADPQPEAATKGGRIRRHVAHFRLSTAELAQANAKARAAGKSLSAYATMAVLKRRDRRPIVPPANKELHADLGRLLGNVNQIAYQLNRGGAEAQRPTREVLTEILGKRGGELFDLLGQVREEVKQLRMELIGVGLRMAEGEIEDEDDAHDGNGA
jgi:Mobilization protein NikA